ncbi:class I SAM-dependent methyltransferase [Massilia horti]|uniref:Class I SAM-dependent methyltransferase n=1 Tax=Massilia horti TaxID=2562153 RepID=A0A4Y9TB92_9BURK|nr:class I SAM-dependent methyltransferase [Massilia horti]TFW36139.1 class I SAM-dependent methyltransferase [Massilia horti]
MGDGFHGTGAPSPWVQRFARLVPQGEVLDLACGGGRHARLFASLGHPVLALDRDREALALAAGPGIRTMEHDLEVEGAVWPFEPGRFAGIVVTNYLYRPLLASLVKSLAPNGVLLYETFAVGNEAFGKPSNPAFLLAPGELLDMATRGGLRVVAYEHGVVSQPKSALVQRLCACGPLLPRLETGLDHLSRQE